MADGAVRNVRGQTVHPRACGGHIVSPGNAANGSGSSPRVRGTPIAARVHEMD
jgi:hypothetical protein